MKNGNIATRNRQILGAYYTPLELAEALTIWAIRTPADTVLDPSFGGCAFFAAGISRLTALGSKDPFCQLAGFDIDPRAAVFVKTLSGYRARNSKIQVGADFLRARPEPTAMGFSAIVGNPPYVRHHRLSDSQIKTAQAAIQEDGFSVAKTASYWPYFVLHSLAFLRTGGRLALVLPFAAASAKYAKPVQHVLRSRFSKLTLIYLKQRVFPDAQEGSVVVLAEGWRGTPRGSRSATAKNVARVHGICSGTYRIRRHDARISPLQSRFGGAVDILRALSRHPHVHELGSIATIRIGIVTGDNSFFILSGGRARELGISQRYLKSILTSGSQFRSLSTDVEQVQELANEKRACFLLIAPMTCRSKSLNTYLNSRAGKRAAKRYKSSVRNPWHSITDVTAPDGFLTYVNGSRPKLVLNDGAVLCTNAIHRLRWTKTMLTHTRKLVALSFISSLGALSSELQGRPYGGGALKLEPSDARRLLIAIPETTPTNVDIAFELACASAENGQWDQVRRYADQVILKEGLGLTANELTQLRRALTRARFLRLRG